MTVDALTAQPDLECNRPEVVFGEIIEEIRHALLNQPRSLQKRIGPSQIGNPCSRALIAKLMGEPEPEEPPNWRAWVGTAMHAGLEDILSRSPMQKAAAGPRYLLEQRVTVGTIGGAKITGSADVFDTLTGCVIDHKTKSKTQLRKHKMHGPGETYRVQAQLYGRGMANAGHRVNTVLFIFYPRDGDLSDTFQWSEPYRPEIAVKALERANQLHALASAVGTAAATALYPRCEDEYCRVCGNYRAPFGAPKPLAHTTAELFGTTTGGTTP